MSTRRHRRQGAEGCEPFAVRLRMPDLYRTLSDPPGIIVHLHLLAGRCRAVVETAAR